MSDIQEQIKLAHKKAEENDIKLLQEENKKQKEVLDKIKELAKENINNGFMRPEIEETTMTFKNALALDILELLEEIE